MNPSPQALLDRYERPLLAFARHRSGDPDAAQDAVQETFLRYCKAAPAGELEALAPWLFTVCRRVLIDQQRRNHRLVAMSDDTALAPEVPVDHAHTPSAALEEKEDAVRLRALIAELPERQREFVRLKFEAGLSYRDIAAATGLSVSNVGTILHHAVAALRADFHSEALA